MIFHVYDLYNKCIRIHFIYEWFIIKETTMEQKKKLVLLWVILAMLLSSLDQTIVSTAIPAVVRDLNGLEHLSWVFTAYMLASTITVPIYGKLSDLFGRRNLYILGIILFLVGSALCGLSQNMTQLILFRGLQWIGAWAMMVNSFAIIWEVFPPAERGKWQGLIGWIFGLASVAWPLLGWWITDNFSWRWVFYVNIPIGILAIVVLALAIPKIARSMQKQSIDYAWALLITTTLVPILLALVWGGSTYAWGSWQILVAFIIWAISLIWFIAVERKAKEPILSPSLFKNKVFVVSIICLFFISMGMFGAIIYIPIFAQGVIGVSATSSGLVLTPLMFWLIAASAISWQVISRTWKYKDLAVTGFVITILWLLLFSSIDVNTTRLTLSIFMVVLGVWLGITMPIFTIAVQAAVTKDRLWEVTAGTQLFRNIWGSVGTAILGWIMASTLAMYTPNLQKEPFAVTMSAMTHSTGALDTNTIQQVLNPEFQKKVQEMLPATQQDSFNHFLAAAKEAFTHSVNRIFIIGTFLMMLWCVAVFFLPQIEIKKKKSTELDEVWRQIGDELETSAQAHHII